MNKTTYVNIYMKLILMKSISTDVYNELDN
jgi:hypothetical protein